LKPAQAKPPEFEGPVTRVNLLHQLPDLNASLDLAEGLSGLSGASTDNPIGILLLSLQQIWISLTGVMLVQLLAA